MTKDQFLLALHEAIAGMDDHFQSEITDREDLLIEVVMMDDSAFTVRVQGGDAL